MENVDKKLAELKTQKDILKETIRFLIGRAVEIDMQDGLSLVDLGELKTNTLQSTVIDVEIEKVRKKLEKVEAQITKYENDSSFRLATIAHYRLAKPPAPETSPPAPPPLF